MPRTHFFWDPVSDNILQERDDDGNVTAEYTTEPGLHGNLISQNRGGVERQYHFDPQGSTLALTDDNQNVTDTYAYNAFGEVTERTGSTVNPFQYIGQKGYYCDEETGEYFVRRRDLSAELARWLSVDPLHFVGQVNSFQYVLNAPTIFRDPSGLYLEDVPTTLPDPYSFPVAEKDAMDVKACNEFYKEQLQKHPGAVKCYQDYMKKMAQIKDPLLRKECERLRFSCICCETHAGYVQGFIFLCANSPSVKGKKTDPSAQALCHEIVHALQFAPCNAGGPKQDEVTCLERLKLEFQAYLCAGQCLVEGEINPLTCAMKSVASARKSGKCGPLSATEFQKQLDEFQKWIFEVFPTLDLEKYCPTQYPSPKK